MNRNKTLNCQMKLLVVSITLFVLLCSDWTYAESVNLPKTGQTTTYSQGDDGDLRTGVSWPDPRFTVGTGAEAECVTDNLTGLMWPKDANLPNGTRNWQGALDYVASINSGAGLCGYTDWRLPNINELESLVNAEVPSTAVWLNAEGFTNVQSAYYWSSTTLARSALGAWLVSMWYGSVDSASKDYGAYVWPVRSGQ